MSYKRHSCVRALPYALSPALKQVVDAPSCIVCVHNFLTESEYLQLLSASLAP